MQNETEDKLRTNLRQTKDKVETELRTNLLSSSNKLLNNKKTTTTAFYIPENLQRVGCSASKLNQILCEEILNEAEIQESLEAFSYDLEHGLIKPKTSPLNFLIGILRKGHIYTSEKLLIEANKKIDIYSQKKEKYEKAKESLRAVKEEKEFEIWLETLSTEERNKLVMPNDLIKEGSVYQQVMLKNHWQEKVLGKEV